MKDEKTSKVRALRWAVYMLVSAMIAGSLDQSWAQTKDQVPIHVGTQKQFFVDDYIIHSMAKAFRILNQPVKYPGNPIIELKPAQVVGGDQLVITMGSVIYDDEDGLFKMWYDAADYHWRNNVVCYATSKDGIHWDLPNLGLIEYRGSKDNNVVFKEGHGEMAPGVFKDPVESDPQRKFKMIYHLKRSPKLGTPSNGIGVAFSPDGIHWTPATDTPVIAVSDSPNSVMWDPKLRKYVAHTRHNARYNEEHWEGNPPALRAELRPAVGSFFRREVLQSESDDFLNWKPYGVIMKADKKDPPWDQQFYNMEWMLYEDVYFGFLSVYHTLPGMETKITPRVHWMDKVDVQLTFGRDGRTWSRAGERQVFIPNGSSAEDFDRSMIYVMQHPIVVEDEIWIYYVGFSGLHWATNRNELQGGAVGLAKLRLDGFVSVDAGDGTLTTKVMKMSGNRLIVNADGSLGSIRVEILEPGGTTVEGFSKSDAEPIRGDSVRHTVRWKGDPDLSPLKGKPIVLKFYINRSKLYSFVFQTQ